MLLNLIQKANDVKKIQAEQLGGLADEIRMFILEHIAHTGGHLASNLGTVELTIALHRFCTLPQDKIIWDVGHQAYTHKILTGRRKDFDHLREYGGLSGFPNMAESACDSFNTGHSTTSLSAGLGMVIARERLGQKHRVIAVIGDGAITGGMAAEALNNAVTAKSNYMMVLNDNNMSISENIGGISNCLKGLRMGTNHSVLPEALSEWGIQYIGPVDGHNIEALEQAFKTAEKVQGPVLVHVLTQKGKGYCPAEKNPVKFHGISAFDLQTGQAIKSHKKTWTDCFGKALLEAANKDKRVCGITAAMSNGTGLAPLKETCPDQYFDVGLAEEHAVTFAAGLAVGGLKPVVAIYSCFLQRAYDQMIHDVCMQHLHVIFAIDRAGLVGEDGSTHHGLLDLSYLSTMPEMTVMAPKNDRELEDMLQFALDFDRPIAFRYPRGEVYSGLKAYHQPIEYGQAEMMIQEKDIALVAVGSMVENALAARALLKKQGFSVTLINARFIKPIDTSCLKTLAQTHRLIVTLEENEQIGGFGEQVAAYCDKYLKGLNVYPIAIEDCYVSHGNKKTLEKTMQMDASSIAKRVAEKASELF